MSGPEGSGGKGGALPEGALELLERRASLRLLWELRGGPLRFRALQRALAASPALLNVRLKDLRAASLVELDEAGYRLTARGETLVGVLRPLYEWAGRELAGAGTGIGSAPGAAEAEQRSARERQLETTRLTTEGEFLSVSKDSDAPEEISRHHGPR